jgi:hypothetical protein
MDTNRKNNMIKSADRIGNWIGFGLAAAFAVTQKWSLQEFCWSIWVAGLFLCWFMVITSGTRVIMTARKEKTAYEESLPFLTNLSPYLFLIGITAIVLAVGWIAMILYTYLFGFYGLFLSVFATMQPEDLFGPNGFINSDFFTPVAYLAEKLWPMIFGTLIANTEIFFWKNPWHGILRPFQTQIVQVHIMVVVMPFLTLIVWMLFKTAYQPITILLLLGIFYLLPFNRNPKNSHATPHENKQAENHTLNS